MAMSNLLMFLTVTFLISACGNSTAPDMKPIPTDGLVAYYPFNGNAKDDATSSNNGIVHGVELIEDRAGNSNRAFSFDGVDDFIGLPSDFDLAQRTISLWFSVNEVDGYNRLYNSDHPNLDYSSTNIDVFKDNQSNEYKLRLEAGGGQGDDILYTIVQNNWYHAVLMIDSLNTSAYVNGEIINSVPFMNHHSDVGFPRSFIGTNRDTSRYFFNGVIDDIRIYDRTLREDEIQSLFDENI